MTHALRALTFALVALPLFACSDGHVVIFDAEGREVGRLLGPAEWAGEDARALIKSQFR